MEMLRQVAEREAAGHVDGTALHISAFSPSQAPAMGESGEEIIFVPQVNAASV
jgi:hypothetical protein